MEFIPARQIVTRSKCDGSFYGYDYNMNLYRGCCHGCIYCDSRSDCYRIDDFERVRAKADALTIVERELRYKHKTGVIATGAMSDPYNPFELEHELTRGALELIDRYGFGVSALTKSPLIARDAGLLQRIAHHSLVSAKLTITAADDGLAAKLEPHVAASSERFGAIRALSDAGLFTGVAVVPVLPFITDTDENIRALVETTAAAGGRYVYLETGVTLRTNQRDYYYERLDELFPGLRAEYEKTFGDRYRCTTPRHKAIRAVLAAECGKHGLLYKLPDILRAQSEPYEQPQLRLF
jgi:DNA repair photolyase